MGVNDADGGSSRLEGSMTQIRGSFGGKGVAVLALFFFFFFFFADVSGDNIVDNRVSNKKTRIRSEERKVPGRKQKQRVGRTNRCCFSSCCWIP